MHTEEKNIYLSIVIASITLGAVVTYFIVSLIRHQKKIQELNRKKMLREFAVLEGERLRIAADMHDELGPLLSAVKLHISTIETSRKQDEQTVSNINWHIDLVIEKIREVAYNLMPATLILRGLFAAISEYVDKTMRLHRLNIELIIDDEINFDKDLQINIYRIVQECVHNTVKHAKATYMRIEIKIADGNFEMHIADNGVGYNVTSQDVFTGNGLRNLRSRTELLKGAFHVKSSPGNGVQYIFEIPLSTITAHE